METAPIKLAPQQERALELMLSGKNVFLTGEAGTGKSTILREFREKCTRECVFLAPTGIAAINVSGATLHSFFQLKPGLLTPDSLEEIGNKSRRALIRKVKTIVIDEISMVRSDVFAAIDWRLRSLARGSNGLRPFGGKQIILVGDFFQLPPVVKSETEDEYLRKVLGGYYAFQTPLWKRADFRCVFLKTVHRQQNDNLFLAILNHLRHGDLETADLRIDGEAEPFNALEALTRLCVGQPPLDPVPVYLCTTNREAQTMNALQKSRIEGEDHAFNAVVRGKFPERDYPTPALLEFKGGAGMLMAETGCGKSSFVMQIALHWGAGLSCFGLEPIRPLKILLIQAENDDRDLQEEISGVCRGASAIGRLSSTQIDAAKAAVRIISDATHSGGGFIDMLKTVLEREKETDIVIIDPIFAFAGCDLSDQESVSHFLRNQINPILQDRGIAMLFVHHTQKPSRAKTQNENFNTAYSYHGSAEIINWARFALVLDRLKDKDGNLFFRLSAPKRGRRLGWESDVKFLRWSDNYIYWEELPSAPDMPPSKAATPEERAEQREAEKKRRLIEDAESAAELLQPGQSMTATNFRNAIIGRLSITSKDRIEAVIATCIERGTLVKRPPTKEAKTSPGVRRMIERPADPPVQPAFFNPPEFGEIDLGRLG